MSRSRVINIRITDAEAEGLEAAAAELGVSRSRIIRRLLREFLRGHPDYFDDGLGELRAAHLALVGASRALRQHARTSPDAAMPELREHLDATSSAVGAMKSAMGAEITATRDRSLRVGDFGL